MQYRIRPFDSIEEYRDCVTLQEDTWGVGFSERVAPAILKVSQLLGGVAAGAYDPDDRLVGFVFGMTGMRNGELVHWSDMLAVRPEHRGTGLGTRLKAYQRERQLEGGVTRMHWTFDPLRAANAHLNFNRLGITAPEYAVDMYGQTDSPLHRGIGTDRFIALWKLDSGRVSAALEDERSLPEPDLSSARPVLAALEDSGVHPRPGEPELSDGNEPVSVAIPSDIASIMDDEPGLAVEWRMATRGAFMHYIAAGYEAVGFARGERTSTYLMARGGETVDD